MTSQQAYAALVKFEKSQYRIYPESPDSLDYGVWETLEIKEMIADSVDALMKGGCDLSVEQNQFGAICRVRFELSRVDNLAFGVLIEITSFYDSEKKNRFYTIIVLREKWKIGSKAG